MNNLITQLIAPKKIVKIDGNISGAENLLVCKDEQIGLNENLFMTVKGAGSIILDYGIELCGGVKIATFYMDAIRAYNIRIRFGESVCETMSEIGEKGASNDHSLRDMKTQLVNYSNMEFGQTGFRFVKIDFLEDTILRVKSILAKSSIHNLPPIYSYKGKDSAVAKIFETAKHTIDLCMQDYIWDGIKRDRLVWIGDMHPEMLAAVALYGRQDVIEKSLDFVKKQTPLPGWMNDFPMYSMWWIIILCDYYKLTNCMDYIENQKEYLTGLIDLMNGCVNENGELNYPSYFVDWPTHDKKDEKVGVRAINILAINKAIELQNILKLDTSVSVCLLKKLNKVTMTIEKSKQVIGLKYLAVGNISSEEKELLLVGGAKGMSTFMSYYILNAIAENVSVEVATDIMKEYYGAMLERGATSFWEDFNMDWLDGSGKIDELPKPNTKDIHGDYGDYCYKGFRHSLCHGWSSGVIYFIKKFL